MDLFISDTDEKFQRHLYRRILSLDSNVMMGWSLEKKIKLN